MKEYLDSDRVNFLVWRYLLEGNYRETAVKFQKEWHKTAPHRQLDFARYVESHALVNVLNKGLLYNSLEREFAQSQQVAQQENATAVVEALQLGVFGPLLAHPPAAVAAAGAASHGDGAEEKEHDPEEDAEGEIETVHDIENTRKRQMERAPQQALVNGGSPAKRPRLSNGYENGVDAATDPMELDGQHGSDNHAYPSPLEGEQAPTPAPRTDGPEQGTQIEKVQELAPETIFIPLGADEAPVSSPLARMSSENAPVLLHCQWNPQDPTKLAAGGTDALARIWTISRTATSADPAGHVSVPPFHSLADEDTEPKATVTAMAWNRDGTAIAIASESADNRGRINLWGADGSHMQRMEVPEAPVIKLRWSPNNDAILAISPENEDALVTVYASAGANSMSHVVSGHSPDIDATWLSEQDILLCGGQLLMSLRCEGGSIFETKRFETRPEDSMSQVHFDWRARLAATCGDKGFVDIWDANGKRREIKAHDGPVTALAWQPLSVQSAAPEDERLLASGGEDGAIFIWNALSTDGKSKCSMTMGEPIVALAFTPDGAFIAGATHERILIWKVGDHSIPRASWDRMPHPGWLSPQVNSESEEEPEHTLCWDSTGQKLAFGVNSRLALINFR